MKKQRALSDFGMLLIVAVLGVALFFVLPHFLNQKSGNPKKASTQASQSSSGSTTANASPSSASSSSGDGLSNYTKAYQIGTTKAKAAQEAAGERNSGY